MMNPRRINCLLQVHPVIDDIADDQQHRVSDGRTASRADREVETAVRSQDERGGHG